MRRSSGFRAGRLKRVGGLVNGSLDSLGLRGKVMEHQAVACWSEVVGAQIAAVSFPEKVRDGVLFVCCKSSTWSNELSLHKGRIVDGLNSSVGAKVINDIRFSARGFRKPENGQRKEQESTRAKALETVPLPEGELEAARNLASTAAVAQLSERIERAVGTSKRLNELKRREGWKPCANCDELHNGEHSLCDNCR